MKIINPNVELWQQDDKVAHVARCARVCYGKESGNDKVLYNNLIKNGHWSMFRHESIYAMIPNHDRNLGDLAVYYANCPYIHIHVFDGYTYVSTNKNFIMDNEDYPFINLIKQYQVDKNEFIGIEEHRQIIMPMLRYTFKVTTQISTSRELNRVSPNNIAEQSTRYVYENGTICRPHWMSKENANIINKYNDDFENLIYVDEIDCKVYRYINRCKSSFDTYKDLINKEEMSRQDARGVLPLDTATICAYTYSANEWRDIIDLRYYGTTGQPHPNAKIIADMIRDELIKLGYEFR